MSEIDQLQARVQEASAQLEADELALKAASFMEK